MSPTLSTREEYGRALVRLGERSRDVVVLDADLSGSTCTRAFARRFPDRFFNMGISEQDMIGTAAGMSLAGKIAFASSFAIFLTGRCWEQVRQSLALPGVNVNLVGTHGGITVGKDGASHQALEDLAIMRAIHKRNLSIAFPTRSLYIENSARPTPSVDADKTADPSN